MPRYMLMISDLGRPDVWYRAGARLRMCLDEFDTIGEAYRQLDNMSHIAMPVATGMSRLKVVDTRTSEDVSRPEPAPQQESGDLFSVQVPAGHVLCPECDKPFKKRGLATHMRRKHREASAEVGV